MFNLDLLVKNLTELLKSRCGSVKAGLAECGADKNLIDNIKNGSQPSISKIANVAYYFGVSVDSLLGTVPEWDKTIREDFENSSDVKENITMDINDKIFDLLQESGKTAKSLAEAVGVSQGNVTDWKNKRCKPSSMVIPKIADFFHVSPGYLLGTTVEWHSSIYKDYEVAKKDEDKKRIFELNGVPKKMESEAKRLGLYDKKSSTPSHSAETVALLAFFDECDEEARRDLMKYAEYQAEQARQRLKRTKNSKSQMPDSL